MKQLTLSSMQFVVPSPSLLYLVGYGSHIALAYAGAFGWRIQLGSKVSPWQYASRDEAAGALARAMGTTANG